MAIPVSIEMFLNSPRTHGVNYGASPASPQSRESLAAARALISTTKEADVAARSAGSAYAEMASKVYLLSSAARGLKSVLVDPFLGMAQAIGTATEQARKFDISLSGIMGSMSRAREMNRSLFAAGRNSPAMLSELQEAAQTLARSPALSGRLSLAKDNAAATRQVVEYEALLRRMAVMDPGQGMRGSRIAVAELAEGGDGSMFNSMRRRFGITGRTLASQVADKFGGNANEARTAMQSDPSLALEATNRLVNALVPPSSADQMGRLLSVRMEKVKEIYINALREIGDSGLYDKMVGRVEEIGASLLSHFDSPEFKKQAGRISDSLGRILDNIGQLIVNFLKKISGAKNGGDTVGSVAELVAKSLEKVAALSDGLPGLGNGVGGFLKGLTDTIDKAMGKVDELIQSISGFSLSQNLVDPMRLSAWKDGGASLSEARARAVMDIGKRYGIEGITMKKVDLDPLPANAGLGDVTQKGLQWMGNAGHKLLWDGEWNQKGLDDAVKTGLKMAFGEKTVIDLSGVADPAKRAAAGRLDQAMQDTDPRSFEDAGAADRAIQRAVSGTPGLRQLLESVKSGAPRAGADQAKTKSYADDYLPLMRALMSEENYTGPNFSAMSLPVTGALSRVESGDSDSLIRRAATQADGLLNNNLSGDEQAPLRLGAVFGRLKAEFLASDQKFNAAIEEAQALLAGQTQPDKNATTWLAGATKRRDEMRKSFEANAMVMRDGMIDAVSRSGSGMASALGQLPPEVGVLLQERIKAGATTLGNKVAEILSAAGRPLEKSQAEEYYDSLPLDRRMQLATAQSTRRGEALMGANRYGRITDDFGGLRTDLSAEQIESMSPLYERNALNLKGRMLEMKVLPDQRALFEEARAAYQKDPNEQTLADLGIATHDLAETSAKLREVKRATDDARLTFLQFGEDARNALESSLGDAITRLIDGTGDLGDALRGLASDMTAAFSRMAAANIMQGFIGDAGKVDSNGNAGGFGNSLVGSVIDLFTSSGGAAAADGAVWPGGYTPVAAFAQGGTITRPTIGIIGEENKPEAVVPMRGGSIPLGLTGNGGAFAMLPGGRTIPAAFFANGGVTARVHAGPSGGGGMGGQPVIIYNVANYEEAQRRGYSKAKGHLMNEVLKSAGPGGNLRKMLDRRG